MSALEMATAEEEGLFAGVKFRAGGSADPVADLVANNGAEHDGQEQPFQWDDTGGGENSSGDEQGIAGKKKADEESGFNENDTANEGSAALAD
jgi:hypothetical protein